MTSCSLSLNSTSPDHTAQLAQDLAPELGDGDVILLEGDVGAGKTHFARALIQHLMAHAEDVPSPTFTLVQTYPAAGTDIWHADLYRLTSTSEIEELGLIDAFETDICLVEWPDRLGPLSPVQALMLHVTNGDTDDTRMIRASWTDPRWDEKLKVWQP
ncbi:UPF0079 domain containing protein [Sulfitobacter noctilucae]|uniref:tRNA (adenosine(37)-N6)-threonylcarbamoyltransferase complex ATPase subunit type 1 TsaE n=1 Tax=Sulfitobacter noctilucae TaxID=1342302 RepID=UPI00046A8059|nr:tRNA (adenosine(37)-N6)-threonylcarbamoyltransferase complex ATPase subunit type 1 TsaE [Sulfitobacter noctilucae]KIN65767.1 UPF0079 domain containing protein [Sulfitobacter noctilucae]